MIKLINRLGTEKILPITMSWRNVPLDIQIPNQPLYGVQGASKTGKSNIVPRQIILQGGFYHTDKNQIRQEIDNLLPFLMQPPIRIYQQHDDERYLLAELSGAPQDWLKRRSELQIRIILIALDPFFYGPEVNIVVDGIANIQVAGNARVSPLVRTTGSVSNLTLTHNYTGQVIEVSGATGIIEVDNNESTCKVGANNRLDLINEDWLLDGFSLTPGLNQLVSSTAVNVIYKPKWY